MTSASVSRAKTSVAPEVFERYLATRDPALRDELLDEFRWIAVRCAKRFAGRGEPFDELLQIGQIGVMKALDRFEPSRGFSFVSFATPTVLGELRRHFRDATWSIRVNRRAKELHLEVGNALETLTTKLERSPTVAEIAGEIGVSEEEVLEAIEAGAARRTQSLDTPVSTGREGRETSLEHRMGVTDAGMEMVELRIALTELLQQLPDREREIVRLRFFEEMTQSEIGERVGLSQVQVSRLLQSSFEKLRSALHGNEQDG